MTELQKPEFDEAELYKSPEFLKTFLIGIFMGWPIELKFSSACGNFVAKFRTLTSEEARELANDSSASSIEDHLEARDVEKLKKCLVMVKVYDEVVYSKVEDVSGESFNKIISQQPCLLLLRTLLRKFEQIIVSAIKEVGTGDFFVATQECFI